MLGVVMLLLVTPVFSDVTDNLEIDTDCPLSSADDYPNCPYSTWSTQEFDFIIVGAGTAGCTLANRLSENEDWNILLIEAGGVPSNLSEIPGLYIALQETSEDWSFKAYDPKTSTGYKNSATSWAKGKSLGGSSSINAMAVVPGVPEDYDVWSELGNEGWNWDNISQYLDKVLTTIKTTNYKNPLQFRKTLESAVQELGIDTTETDKYGYKDVPLSTNQGERYSFAKGYLSPIKSRTNLCVVQNLLVTTLWFDQDDNVQGVNVNHEGTPRIKATKEVILSAGAINTPKLLMLSGIGPEDSGAGLGINLKVQLPVGRNLMDHMIIPVFVKDTSVNVSPIIDISQRLDIYCLNRTFLDTIGVTNFQGYLNTHNQTTWFLQHQRPNVAVLHFMFPPQEPMLNITLDRFGFREEYQIQILEINTRNYVHIICVDVLHPKSRGRVELTSVDPLVQPRITPNYLSHPEDVQDVLEGVTFIEALVNTKSFEGYEFMDLNIPECEMFGFQSPGYWECYARTFATTVYHPCGTCTMGNDSESSVVNTRLEVWGVDGLRVVDSSVIPDMISGHTNIPTGIVAERAADIIKEDYLDISDSYEDY